MYRRNCFTPNERLEEAKQKIIEQEKKIAADKAAESKYTDENQDSPPASPKPPAVTALFAAPAPRKPTTSEPRPAEERSLSK